MHARGHVAALAALLVALPAAAGARQHQQAPMDATAVKATVDKYCVTCHSERAKTGGLVLEKIDVSRPSDAGEVWEKVVKKLRGAAMPPAAAPRPDAAVLSGVAAYFETALDAEAARAPDPGRPVVHRLNRAEYTNAVRDLLGVEIDGKALLPADDASYGFDNVADVLSITSGLLERYLLVAKKVSRLALGDATIRPVADSYRLPPSLLQDDRMNEDLPFGSRGGLAVRQVFPVDGDYDVRLKLQRNSINLAHAIRGLDEENTIDVHIDGDRVKRFTVPAAGRRQERGVGDISANDMEKTLTVRLPVKAGVRTVAVSFPRRHWYVEGVGVGRLPAASDGFNSGTVTDAQFGKIEMGIDTLQITGPFNGRTPAGTVSRTRVLLCRPTTAAAEAPCARRILTNLARRAYRRTATPDDVATLMTFYDAGRRDATFEAGIQAAIERLLVSPYFLLRKEDDPPAGRPAVYRVSDTELASRLSFFLWSSIPDDELLTLASANRLSQPAVLERQVRRMLRDDRSQAFFANFFGQWLYLRNLESHRPDTKLFPQFDENLRDAFRRETEMFLQSQFRDDRSVLDLLTADYTFVNERLARHYGIPGVYGSHFRRVALGGGARAGLLGQGSILTVTSYADRTSPVVRGKWLLENILGTPPPPPPANVPPFPENKGGDAPRSVRARMEQHRRNPVCASCHSRIDPLGFALENFDGVGRYRTVDDGSAVDASGVLPDGRKFDGPREFRTALIAGQKGLLVESATEKLMTYALGRGVRAADMPAIRRIVRDASSADYRWSALIVNLVKSAPFQMRRRES
jgi:mono/diheme cytochrome c family protein